MHVVGNASRLLTDPTLHLFSRAFGRIQFFGTVFKAASQQHRHKHLVLVSTCSFMWDAGRLCRRVLSSELYSGENADCCENSVMAAVATVPKS